MGTLVARRFKRPEGLDVTEPEDYVADADDPRIEPLPSAPHQTVGQHG